MMNRIILIPVFVSALLIAAHFQRNGLTIAAGFCLLSPGILIVKHPWSMTVIKLFLILSAVEWLRTLVSLVQMRMDYGMPWVRLSLILGTVALFTAASTLVFRHPQLQNRYKKR